MSLYHHRHEHEGYGPGNPWYYREGGRILEVKEIRADAEAAAACMSLDEIRERGGSDFIKAIDYAEPKRRAEKLRKMIQEREKQLKYDLKGYARACRNERHFRKTGEDICGDINSTPSTDIMLKHNHCSYGYFQRAMCRRALELQEQMDLFA